MADIDRLDYSRPPPGYRVDYYQQNPSRPKEWGWTEDVADGLDRHSDSVVGEAEAIAAAWEDYRARHDPPGMWSGFDGMCSCVEFAPRMGVHIAGVAMVECHAGRERFETRDAAKQHARVAAWTRYDGRLALADKLIRFDPRKVEWNPNVWPRCLAWTNDECSIVERWLTEGGEMPEVLRG